MPPLPIDILVRDRFGNHFRARRLIQRYAPEGTEKLLEDIRELEVYAAELAAMPEEELKKLVEERDAIEQENNRRARREEDESQFC